MKFHILSVPGIGTQRPGFSNDLQYDVQKFAKDTELEDNFHFYEITPFSLIGVDIHQEELFSRVDRNNNLDFRKIRKFALSAFGDAVTFERGASHPDSVYRKIHTRLRDRIREISTSMDDDDRMVIVASSLGVHLISTYIYDADNSKGIFRDDPATALDDLSNLILLASIGCNLPLFVSGLSENKIIPFDGSRRAGGFTWDNYYDRDDILGWPLKQLSPQYNDLVNDFEINSGFSPMSHINYWGDNDFTKPFTASLIDLLTTP